MPCQFHSGVGVCGFNISIFKYLLKAQNAAVWLENLHR